MTLTPVYIIFAAWAGLTQFGSLLLNYHSKPLIWRNGIYVGMIGSAYTVMGLAIPKYEFYPCLTFMFATAGMLTCVLASYYFSPMAKDATDEQIAARNAVKHRTLMQVGMGLVVAVSVATCVGYTEGQTADNRVQVGFASVVYRLADEVKSLHEAVNSLRKEVVGIKNEQAESKKRGVKILTNQNRLIENTDRKRKP